EVVLAKDRAEKASRAREEFVAVLSHELRTPLMTILGWAQVFKHNAQLTQNAILEEAVHSLQHNAQNITRLVEECLEIARISESKIKLRSELVDLTQLANTAMESIRSMADGKGLTLCPELASGVHMFGDATRLEEVVLNLLTNAVKYSDAGEIVVRLSRAGEC